MILMQEATNESRILVGLGEMSMSNKIIVTTLCDSIEIANKIQDELLSRKLIAGCQISEVGSTFFWKGKIEKKHEYHLEMRTREELFLDIQKIVKEIHTYEVPEISYYEIKGGNKEFLEWIDEET